MTKPLIAIDLDGTLINDNYPNWGLIKDGAAQYVRQLLDLDYDCIIFSARLNNRALDGSLRTTEEVDIETRMLRAILDTHKLHEVKIWAGEDCKPSADIFIDDRAVEFTNWPDVFDKVVTKLG